MTAPTRATENGRNFGKIAAHWPTSPMTQKCLSAAVTVARVTELWLYHVPTCSIVLRVCAYGDGIVLLRISPAIIMILLKLNINISATRNWLTIGVPAAD